MNVEIKQLPALRVGAVRHIGPYNQVTEAFERLHGIARNNAFPLARTRARYTWAHTSNSATRRIASFLS